MSILNHDDDEHQMQDLLGDLSSDNEASVAAHTSQEEDSISTNALADGDLHFESPGHDVVQPADALDEESQRTNVPSTPCRPGHESGSIAGTTAFELPLRSIFSSPQPTSSVSVNTAHASLSSLTASTSLDFLSQTNGARKTSNRHPESAVPTTMLSFPDYNVSAIVREGDSIYPTRGSEDPTGVPSSSRVTTSSAGNADSQTQKLYFSRETLGRNAVARQKGAPDVPTLDVHLHHIGLVGGRHSDITIHAFGQQYNLHKLILERVSYFSSAFSAPWAESSAKEMTLDPEDIDTNITKISFELALRRIYGTIIAQEEEEECIGLFATGCWLDMPDLVETCVENILRRMAPHNLHTSIRLVTQNCYGKGGDRILASAKAMLCRDGWEMPYEYWDNIPAEIVKDVVSGDPFYVPGEWERWFLTVRLLNRRLRHVALAQGLISSSGRLLRPKPRALGRTAVRAMRSQVQGNGMPSTDRDCWLTVYSHVEIVPLFQLLDTGIHYIHLRFEELQQLRSYKDIFGVPVLPEKVISDALWMSMELRQIISNAQEHDLELDLSQTDTSALSSAQSSGHQEASQADLSVEDDDDGRVHQHGSTRRFWIPTTDVSCILGSSHDICSAPSMSNAQDMSHRSQSISAGFEASEVAWPPDLGGSIFDSHGVVPRTFAARSPPKYTIYPPFRFCAEFPNPRTLKEKKRIYSQTIWYAGSMWNLYIQRVNTPKNQQLGIYLHRAKDKDQSADSLAFTVDDRIGQLERELLLRKHEQRSRQRRTEQLTSTNETDVDDDGTDSSGKNTAGHPEELSARSRPRNEKTKSRNKPQSQTAEFAHSPEDELIQMSDDDDPENELAMLRSTHHRSEPTIPPYVDKRSTINTYFKIYSPSRGGRLLSVYESAPDSFDFGKSWGWLSRQMVVEDGIGGDTTALSAGGNKDGKLRYMVVLGNV